jgi:hypothetical protein
VGTFLRVLRNGLLRKKEHITDEDRIVKCKEGTACQEIKGGLYA